MRKRIRTQHPLQSRDQRSRRTPHSACRTPHSRRRGVTLTEVLMSLLLMAIGVVTLATLFPISILRTSTATRLTRGTILSYNAEAQIYMHDLTVDYVDSATGRPSEFPPPAQAGGETTAVIDPLGWHTYNNAADMAFRDEFGSAALGNQFRRTGIRRIRGHRFVPGSPNATFSSGQAVELAALPDGWINLATAEGPAFTDTDTDGVRDTLAMGVDLATVSEIWDPVPGTAPNPDPQAPLRVLIFDRDGRLSQVRNIDPMNPATSVDVANQTIRVDVATSPLPAAYNQPLFAMIETQEQQFTWMLTCTKEQNGSAVVVKKRSIVVFFRRSFNPNDERFHDVESLAMAGEPGQIGDTTIRVLFNAWHVTNEEVPFYRRGSYVFDPVNVDWYRVQDYTDEDPDEVTLELDSPLKSKVEWLVLMPNVVKVYDR